MSRLRYSTSDLESRTRSEHGFPDAEASLASVSASKLSKASKLRDLLSYLGSKNPLPTPVSRDDVVWLFDNVAFRGPGGGWQAEFVSATFSAKVSAKFVDVVGDIADAVGLARGDSEEATIERRIVPFVMDIQPGKQVKVVFDENTKLKLGPSGRNGISSDLKKLSAPPKGTTVVESRAEVPTGAMGILEMKTVFAEPEGWAVISDVDDTIKITQTSDPSGILRSTFVVSRPQFASAMMGKIQTLVTKTAPWFYLSASPYNLYSFLRDFRERYYPHGQLILRDSSWMTIPGLLSNLTLGTEEYKIERINKVHRWLPKRKLILIGDSTQSDPEAYGEIYRQHPKWVKLILIRRVTDIASVGTEEKNAPSRFERAFEGVPGDRWYVFEDPSECQEILHKVVAS